MNVAGLSNNFLDRFIVLSDSEIRSKVMPRGMAIHGNDGFLVLRADHLRFSYQNAHAGFVHEFVFEWSGPVFPDACGDGAA